MNYIDNSIAINFPVPRDIKYLMDKCEKYDAEANYGAYENYANALCFVVSKEAYVQGHLTKEQWEMIERRYLL